MARKSLTLCGWARDDLVAQQLEQAVTVIGAMAALSV